MVEKNIWTINHGKSNICSQYTGEITGSFWRWPYIYPSNLLSWHSKVITTLVGVQDRVLAYCSDLGLLIED